MDQRYVKARGGLIIWRPLRLIFFEHFFGLEQGCRNFWRPVLRFLKIFWEILSHVATLVYCHHIVATLVYCHHIVATLVYCHIVATLVYCHHIVATLVYCHHIVTTLVYCHHIVATLVYCHIVATLVYCHHIVTTLVYCHHIVATLVYCHHTVATLVYYHHISDYCSNIFLSPCSSAPRLAARLSCRFVRPRCREWQSVWNVYCSNWLRYNWAIRAKEQGVTLAML